MQQHADNSLQAASLHTRHLSFHKTLTSVFARFMVLHRDRLARFKLEHDGTVHRGVSGRRGI